MAEPAQEEGKEQPVQEEEATGAQDIEYEVLDEDAVEHAKASEDGDAVKHTKASEDGDAPAQ